MNLGTAQSAIISAIVFNALIIPLLVPLALRGVRYRPVGATALLRRNLLIYGVGGVIAPFVGHQARGPPGPQPARRLTDQNPPMAQPTGAATTRSSSAWPPGWARPTACSRRAGRPGGRARRGDRRARDARPRRDGRAGGGPRAAAAPGGRVQGHADRRDGPARDLPPRSRAVPDRRAGPHERAGARARQALPGHRRRARRRHRRVLHRQRPAPGEPERPGRGAHRRARAGDVPRPGALARRTRSCSWT